MYKAYYHYDTCSKIYRGWVFNENRKFDDIVSGLDYTSFKNKLLWFYGFDVELIYMGIITE